MPSISTSISTRSGSRPSTRRERDLPPDLFLLDEVELSEASNAAAEPGGDLVVADYDDMHDHGSRGIAPETRVPRPARSWRMSCR